MNAQTLVAAAAVAAAPPTDQAPLSLAAAYEVAMQMESEGREEEAQEVLVRAREAYHRGALRPDVRLHTPERSH